MYQSLHTVIRLDDRLKRHFSKRGKKLMDGVRTKKKKDRDNLIARAKKARKDRGKK